MNALSEFLKEISPAITWVIVIVGWKFVSHDHNKRECRKELRALLNTIRDTAVTIEGNAYDYYRSAQDAASAQLSMQIRREIGHLGALLATAKSLNKKFSLDLAMNEFRQAMTGHDFDSATRVARPHTDRMFADLTSATLTFTQAIERVFAETYSN